MSNHNVLIVEDKYGCTVAPVSLCVKKGEEVTFLNYTGNTVDVDFLDGDPFNKTVGSVNPGNEAAKKRTVAQDASFHSYLYEVYCHSKEVYAQASIPRIIIYDPIV